MTSTNVEFVRRGYQLFNEGRLEDALEGFDPDIEWSGPDLLPEGDRVYRGPEGVAQFWGAWREIFDDFRIEIEEMIDAGDRVVAMVRVSGRGKDSGAQVATPSFPHVWTIAHGKAVRMEMLPDRATALVAVGLDPDLAPQPDI